MTLFLMKLLVLPLQSANFFLSQGEDALSTVGHVPETVHLLCKEAYNIRFPVCSNDFSLLLKYRLLQETADSLVHWQDISSPLANRIIRCRDQFQNWEQFCELLKTKELTYTRISRALLHVCLEIPDLIRVFPLFMRVILGFQNQATPLFYTPEKESRIPLITKLASAALTSKAAEDMIQEDVHSANLYESVVTDKFQRPFHNEYRQSIIRL